MRAVNATEIRADEEAKLSIDELFSASASALLYSPSASGSATSSHMTCTNKQATAKKSKKCFIIFSNQSARKKTSKEIFNA